ncbi:MAG: protein-disulfide reductase DsbD N-terminal domain-containing protein [Terriglobales bacterium]
MKSKLASAAVIAAAAALALTFALAATPKPVHWSLSARLTQGDHVAAHLHATIQSGWHLYAMNQTPGGPIATRISLAPHQPFTLSGAIHEAVPHTQLDPNFNLKTSYYLGSASFTIPLRAASRTRAEASTVVINVRYQTCNDRICLPPTVIQLTAPVRH